MSAHLSAGLRTHYAPWQRNRCRRTMNGLASAQVTSRRCVFFFSPRKRTSGDRTLRADLMTDNARGGGGSKRPTSNTDAALNLAQHGFHVLPIKAGAKFPPL